jgi:predicted CopG family antitoxin
MPTERTTIQVRGDTYRELRDRKDETDSFDDTIKRLLNDG